MDAGITASVSGDCPVEPYPLNDDIEFVPGRVLIGLQDTVGIASVFDFLDGAILSTTAGLVVSVDRGAEVVVVGAVGAGFVGLLVGVFSPKIEFT